jgi:hypothetical protein
MQESNFYVLVPVVFEDRIVGLLELSGFSRLPTCYENVFFGEIARLTQVLYSTVRKHSLLKQLNSRFSIFV